MPLLGCGSRIIYTELGHEMHKHIVRDGKNILKYETSETVILDGLDLEQ